MKEMLLNAPEGWQHPQLQQHTAARLPNATLGWAPGTVLRRTPAPRSDTVLQRGQRRPEPSFRSTLQTFGREDGDNAHYRPQQAALTHSAVPPPARPPPPSPTFDPHLPELFMGSLAARRHRPHAMHGADTPRTAHLPPAAATASSRRQDGALRLAGYIAAGAQPLS